MNKPHLQVGLKFSLIIQGKVLIAWNNIHSLLATPQMYCLYIIIAVNNRNAIVLIA
jgi:hypothetical protein